MEFGLHSTYKGDQAIRGLHSAHKGWSPYGLSGAIDYNFCCLHGQITLKSLMSWVEPHNKSMIKKTKRGALMTWSPLFYYAFCCLYCQITLKSLMSWSPLKYNRIMVIKSKGLHPLFFIILLLWCSTQFIMDFNVIWLYR